jgi:Secretion system C-terminal sorting domain/FIMAH domain
MKNTKIIFLIAAVLFYFADFSNIFSQTDNLLLWNKLGSQTEIENSDFGPDGSIYGSGISFPTGFFDNGFTSNGSNTGPNFGLWEAFNPDYDLAGTVEFWWKPQRNYDEGNSPPDEVFISGLWGNPMKVPFQLIYRWREHEGLGGIEARVHCTDGLEHVFRIGKVAPFNAGDWVHIAFLWDIEGIHEEGEPIFYGAYVDGIYYPFFDVNSPGVSINYRIEKRLGAYLSMGYYDADWGVRLEGILDNIKVWNYAKTDFSDRFLEPTIELAIEDLESIIFELDLPSGTENSLVKSLVNVIKSLEKGNEASAVNQLESLINKIEAQRGKKLTEEEADNLITEVQKIIDAIENDLAKSSFNSDQIVEQSLTPDQYQLKQNYPNPFNPNTQIKYQLPERGFVTIKIYNVMGQEINTLVNQIKEPGTYKLTFDGDQLSSGIYYCILKTNDYHETIKMILLK